MRGNGCTWLERNGPQRRGVRPNGISDNSPAGNADGGLHVAHVPVTNEKTGARSSLAIIL
jgi:hypothetical protein